MSTRNPKGDSAVITQKKSATKLQKPKFYKVILHNDDFTTMEFVVAILQSIFHHGETEATAIMLNIHQHGMGVAGLYPYQIAEAKVAEVMHTAEKAEFPLLCTLEPDEDRDESDDN